LLSIVFHTMIMMTRSTLAFLLLTSVATTAKVADQCAEEGACAPAEQEPETWSVQEDGSGSNPGPEQCHLYMAPSTLGVANMGMYTGVDLKDQEVVNFPEIVVPLLFREWGQHTPGFDDGSLWERYIWEGSVTDLETYEETDTEVSKAGFIPGIGCTINAVMDMNNIDSTHGSTYDTAGLHRSKDPGSGAFTPYHSSITNAAEDVPAGAELFAGYGAEWIPEIPGAQITLDKQLDIADDFLNDEYIPFVQEHADEMSDDMKQALWEFASKDFPVYSQAMTNLPRHPWSEVEDVIKTKLEQGDDDEEVSITRHFIRKQHMRTLEWLRTHPNSYCQDHIRPDISTIPQAGRGAFANRDLPEGTVVGYAPLIHIGKDGRKVLHIQYDNVYQPGKRHQHDLVINYSFFHKNSTMILTPYGGMVNYINHAAGEKANVKVRFPNKELVAHKPEWLNNDPEFFHNAFEKIGLSFEYVALRDIKEGEEVFMDYGPEWEAAWEEHVQNWKPLAGSEDYLHSTQIDEPFLRTQAEQTANPYPSTVQTMCLASYTTDEETGDYVFTPMLRETTYRWYCDVIERHGSEEEGYTYDVDLRIDEGEQPASEADQEWVHVKNFAPDSVFLMDRVFSNDWHLPGAFRQPIAIPDDVMPPAWENGPDTYVLPEDGTTVDEEEDEGEYDEDDYGDGYYDDEEEMELAEEY